ncbi:hypothetical protein [Paenibacillus protaetiae]|uniref:Uncharacterized protein n=1 Tax=Paenibacillus protaetiae TaxID=2509456 RepID=A0A4P6F9Q2_9BACL|nr:hypothetical protein [Paenibacillus protaetiae]QAY67218.1 hypothetical protein ET464_13220 [Paenibacillus protaetiae]
MNVWNQEQKKVRLAQFLKRLSEDPTLSRREAASLNEADLAGLPDSGRVKQRVDLAAVTTALLHKRGIDACFEDMMEFIIQGGTVGAFIDAEGWAAVDSKRVM